MSTTGISGSSSVPGFDVLFPSADTTTTSTSPSTAPASTSPGSSSSTGLNVYQQTADSITSWEYSYLYQSIEGNGPSTLPEYTDGGSVTSFASLATQLGAITDQTA